MSGKNHVESNSMHATARPVDYSDFTFLKDLELYGGRGIIAQGPIVPLVAESHQADEEGVRKTESKITQPLNLNKYAV